jgi:hypothetical protein
LIFINDWQTVQFVVPDNIVGFGERNSKFSGNQFGEWCHKFAYFFVEAVAGDAEIAAGYNPQ